MTPQMKTVLVNHMLKAHFEGLDQAEYGSQRDWFEDQIEWAINYALLVGQATDMADAVHKANDLMALHEINLTHIIMQG